MKAIPYWHVDAFADAPLGGNQAAVMLFDEWPDDELMVRIAAENLFAETAFLVPWAGEDADWELRWCTPTEEVRLCGHATMASGHVMLAHAHMVGAPKARFATRQAGVLEVARADEGYALSLPAIRTVREDWPEAVTLLGAKPAEVWLHPDGYGIYLFEDERAVRALDPDLRGLARLGNDQFICTAPGAETDVVSRVFVPGGGVDEDSFTGSAHAALTPFWAARLGRDSFTALQASTRKGRATCRLEEDRAVLQGACATVVEGAFYLSG